MATRESDLWQIETRSEAVYLDGVTADGTTGFIARICRFPAEGLAWNWLHIFHHGHVHSFTSHEVPCGGEAVDETADDVLYQSGEFEIRRRGDRLAPRGSLIATAMLHSGDANPHGDGALLATIAAHFEPALDAVQTRAGRSEVLGVTEARITLGDAELEFRARGQFHEQVQTEPRFDKPFSYGSLRGDNAGCIFIRGVRGATGTLTVDGNAHVIRALRLSAPAVVRQIEIDTDAGSFAGQAVATYRYEIPIFHLSRPGSIVTLQLGDHEMSGCINDLVMGDLIFDTL